MAQYLVLVRAYSKKHKLLAYSFLVGLMIAQIN